MLKFFVRDLIHKGINARNILYFSCEPLNEKNDITDLITLFDKISGDGEKFIFLDEITKIKNWELGVKFFLDSPLKANKRIVVTGSNALFLKHGTERMPGRMVETKLALPMSFRSFLTHFGSKSLRSAIPKASVLYEKLDAKNINEQAKKLLPFSEEIDRWFRIYTKTGGFLKAIYEYLEHETIKEKTYETYVHWILGDLSSIDKSETFFRGVIRGIVKNYASATSYLSIAKETAIQSHTTVSEYLCTTEDLLLANTLYHADLNKKIPLPRKEKKHYFTDPFLYSAFKGYIYGKYQDYSEEKLDNLVEGIVCEGLSRLNRRNLDHSFFLWYFKKKKETDFVVANESGLTGIEVKWQDKASARDFANFFSFKNRVLLVKSGFEHQEEKNFIMLPIPLFLALIKPISPSVLSEKSAHNTNLNTL
jgi:predicted AAA+ superfamily ATPase